VLLLVLGAVCVISGRRYTRKKKNTPLFHEGEKGSGQTGGTRTGVDNEEDWSDIELGDSMVGRY
jgi:membrane protein implicated in regulation of membrane protease activity